MHEESVERELARLRFVLSSPTRVSSQDGTSNDTVNGGTESCICQRDIGAQVSNCP
jgi:hypothetical protein